MQPGDVPELVAAVRVGTLGQQRLHQRQVAGARRQHQGRRRDRGQMVDTVHVAQAQDVLEVPGRVGLQVALVRCGHGAACMGLQSIPVGKFMRFVSVLPAMLKLPSSTRPLAGRKAGSQRRCRHVVGQPSCTNFIRLPIGLQCPVRTVRIDAQVRQRFRILVRQRQRLNADAQSGRHQPEQFPVQGDVPTTFYWRLSAQKVPAQREQPLHDAGPLDALIHSAEELLHSLLASARIDGIKFVRKLTVQ